MNNIEKASAEWQMSNNPICIGGNNFADIALQMNINPAFVAGAEWMKESISKIVANLFESPCNYSPIDEEMFIYEKCEEICGSDEQTDANCWKRYFELKLKQL